jgi:transposase
MPHTLQHFWAVLIVTLWTSPGLVDTEIRWYTLPPEVSLMAKRKRTVFPKEFKLEAVRLVLDKDMSAAQVARDLGISPEYIYRWKREFQNDPAFAFPGHGKMAGDEAELKRLQKRVKELEEDREILKISLGYFVKDDK